MADTSHTSSKSAGAQASGDRTSGIQLDGALTRKVAELARLELTAEESALFAAQLGAILGHVDQLAQVDVTGVEPMIHPLELPTPLREDVVQPSPRDAAGNPKVLQSAPDVLHGGFKVPPVL